MSLTFSREKEAFVVTQTIHTFHESKVTIVRWALDLSTKRVNDEPPRPTTKEDVAWFHRHYAKHFFTPVS